ncbi:HAD family hydrolase [Coprobacter sp.]
MDCNVAALFDLDGVIVDTEFQYSIYWDNVGAQYLSEPDHFGNKIKGNTLRQIFEKYFPGQDDIQQEIAKSLDEWERNMSYDYIPGILEFLKCLRKNGVRTAIVTSSNDEKMTTLYKVHPDIKLYFDTIVTANQITRSKPDPECYLLAARLLRADILNCFVFEDSLAGLAAGRAAGMTVIGLSTTLPYSLIEDKADIVIPDFRKFDFEKMISAKRS